MIEAPPPGVYRNVPMATYHQWNAASNSRLSRLRQSAAHLKAYLDEPPEDTKATRIGRALHTAILEPHLYNEQFVVAGQCVGKTKDGAQCKNPGLAHYGIYGWRCGISAHTKEIPFTEDSVSTLLALPQADFELQHKIMRKVEAHPAARGLLRAREDVELSIVWRDPITGVLCKARLDVHAPGIDSSIVDIKSCLDASKKGFSQTIYKHGYHCQAAFYLSGAAEVGLEAEHFNFIACEKPDPQEVGVYCLMDSAVDAGRDILWGLEKEEGRTGGVLAKYAECQRTGIYPGYSTIVEDIALPDYAWSQITEEVGG